MCNQTTSYSGMIQYFHLCDDPRNHRIQHQLIDIIVISVLAIICGEEGWEGFYEWACDKEKYLKTFLSLKNGIPSPDTLRRVIERLDPQQFLKAFTDWSEALSKRSVGQVCIDGKVLKGVEVKGSPLRLVSAWSEENQMLLGMKKVDSKNNEITGIHEILDMLLLKEGDTVSIDAIGCQTKIVSKIVQQKAAYIIAVKQNQKGLWEEINNYFNQATLMPTEAGCNGISYKNTGRGRKETHHIWTSSDLEWLPQKDKWAGLKSIVCVLRNWVEKGKKKKERRYYISSLDASAEEIGRKIQRHWSIENEFHWHLDVTFREDDSQISAEANENLRVARAIALKLLKEEKTFKKGIKAKMNKCNRSEKYLSEVMSVGNF